MDSADKDSMVDWDKRYREGFYKGATEPHDLLRKFWQLIPGKNVVDIAMGNGRDSMFLVEKGFRVYGMERSIEAIRIAVKHSGLSKQTFFIVQGDAASIPFKDDSADCVIVFYFLLRSNIRSIPAILKKGGILIYETFLRRQNEIDRRRNPDYLLEDGELISFFRDFEILFYEETISGASNKRRVTARFIGRKR